MSAALLPVADAVRAAAADGPMKGVIMCTEDIVVSSDLRGECHTSIFDPAVSVQLNEKFVKLLAWYDNEVGFSCKMLDLTRYIDSVRNAQ